MTSGRKPRRFRLSLWLPVFVMAGTVIFVLVMLGRGMHATIAITATVVSEPVTDPFQSRFLPSTFYFPIDTEHPKDKEGRPMAILAQINLEEVPNLRGYPKRGILQFFINAHDDLLGWDENLFGDPSGRDGYLVRYFSEVDREPKKLHTDFSFLPDPTAYGIVYLPLDKECALTFAKKWQFISEDDYRFRSIYGEDFFKRFGSLEDKIWDWFWHVTYRANDHKIGGWASFAQDDPRPEDEDWLLLFQMDSDSDADIWWGDTGTGNFFIRPEDLKKRDFSKVVYEYQSG